MFRRAAAVILALVLVALPGMLLQSGPGLVVSATTGDGQAVVCARVSPDALITLTFTHSMFGGDVREMYRVDADGVLIRERVVTDNAAAAEYYATDGRTEQRADGYEVISAPFSTSDLVIRVDQRGNHQLTIGQTTWNLADTLSEPTQVRITTDRSQRTGVQPCVSASLTTGTRHSRAAIRIIGTH